MSKSNLNITESSDFPLLLELMPLIKDNADYALLPELFTIIGHEKLIKLCKYAGGETLKIPTLSEVSDAIECLEWYYKVYIEKSKTHQSVPLRYRLKVSEIKRTIDARNNQS